MEQRILRTFHYTDKWGGTNYGCYPVNIPGENIKKRLDASTKWKLISKEDYIDARNDNQCDIHRGSDFIYQKIDGEDSIFITLARSRSGKTKDWTFKLTFTGPIDFKVKLKKG